MLNQTKGLMIRSHLDHLAKINDIHLVPVSDIEASASWMEEGIVWAPPATDIMSYFVTLHEIGHFYVVHKKLSMLEEEYEVWKWALDRSKFKPDRATWQIINSSMTAYVRKAKRDKRIKMPDSSHPYWELLKESSEKINA